MHKISFSSTLPPSDLCCPWETMQMLYRPVLVKSELSWKTALNLLACLHSNPCLWWVIVTERMRLWTQVSKMSFLCRVAGLSLRERVELRHQRGAWHQVTAPQYQKEPVEVVGHLVRMPPRNLHREVFQACPTGRGFQGRLRTWWRNYISQLAWVCRSVPLEGWRRWLGKMCPSLSAETAAPTWTQKAVKDDQILEQYLVLRPG